jgi:hypothetical protein
MTNMISKIVIIFPTRKIASRSGDLIFSGCISFLLITNVVRAPSAISVTSVDSSTNVADKLQLVPLLGAAKFIV